MCNEPETKTCRVCGKTKLVSSFEPQRRVCKACKVEARTNRRRAGLDPSYKPKTSVGSLGPRKTPSRRQATPASEPASKPVSKPLSRPEWIAAHPEEARQDASLGQHLSDEDREALFDELKAMADQKKNKPGPVSMTKLRRLKAIMSELGVTASHRSPCGGSSDGETPRPRQDFFTEISSPEFLKSAMDEFLEIEQGRSEMSGKIGKLGLKKARVRVDLNDDRKGISTSALRRR